MNDRLAQLLDVLASRDEPDRGAVEQRCQRALNWESVAWPPQVATYPLPDHANFQPYPHREVFDDPEKMLYNELTRAFDTSIALRAEVGDDLPLTVRANFGTVLIASTFGAPVRQTDDNPPWVMHDHSDGIPLGHIAGIDPLDLSQGWIPRVVETMQVYHAVLDRYPELKRRLRIVLPDLQGPFDNLELIRGSEVLLELVTEPDAVDRALHTLATAQIALARHFGQWTTEPVDGYCHQHGVMLKGNILLRNDTCIMLSPTMYRDQIAPHDERVLRELDGGGIHSCGNIGHLVDEYLALPSIRSLDLGQSEMNDMELIYQKAAARRVPLVRVAVSPDDLASGEASRRYPTGAMLIHRADDFATAVAASRSHRHSARATPSHPPEP